MIDHNSLRRFSTGPDLFDRRPNSEDLREQAVARLAVGGRATACDVRDTPAADGERARDFGLRLAAFQQRVDALGQTRFGVRLFVHAVQHALDATDLAFDTTKAGSGLLRKVLVGHGVSNRELRERLGAAPV